MIESPASAGLFLCCLVMRHCLGLLVLSGQRAPGMVSRKLLARELFFLYFTVFDSREKMVVKAFAFFVSMAPGLEDII